MSKVTTDSVTVEYSSGAKREFDGDRFRLSELDFNKLRGLFAYYFDTNLDELVNDLDTISTNTMDYVGSTNFTDTIINGIADAIDDVPIEDDDDEPIEDKSVGKAINTANELWEAMEAQYSKDNSGKDGSDDSYESFLDDLTEEEHENFLNGIGELPVVNNVDIVPDVTPVDLKNRYSRYMADKSTKYGVDNWKLGIPNIRSIDAIFRHLILYYLCDVTEDHLAAIVFNVACIMNVEELVAGNRLPKEYVTYMSLKESKPTA